MMLEKKNVIFFVSVADDRRGVDLIAETIEKDYPEYLPMVFDESAYADDKTHKFSVALDRAFQKVFPKKYDEHKRKSSEKRETANSTFRKKRSVEYKRIHSIIQRFDPVTVVATTPKLLNLCVLANKKRKKQTKVVGLCQGFSADITFYSKNANGYIVDNADVKKSLIGRGAQARSVLVLGSPCVTEKYDFEKVFAAKREMGLNDKPTIYLSGGIFGDDKVRKVLELILDQGDYINTVVFCGENEDLFSYVSQRVEKAKAQNVKVIMSGEMEHIAYLSSDIVVTTYDPTLIASSMVRRVPTVLFAPKTRQEESDFSYLGQRRAAFYAEDLNKIIIDIYKIIQTDVARFYRMSDDTGLKVDRLTAAANALTDFVSE